MAVITAYDIECQSFQVLKQIHFLVRIGKLFQLLDHNLKLIDDVRFISHIKAINLQRKWRLMGNVAHYRLSLGLMLSIAHWNFIGDKNYIFSPSILDQKLVRSR